MKKVFDSDLSLEQWHNASVINEIILEREQKMPAELEEKQNKIPNLMTIINIYHIPKKTMKNVIKKCLFKIYLPKNL